MKKKVESAENRIKKIIGAATFDLIFLIYERISSLGDAEPLPKELNIINNALGNLCKKGYITQDEAAELYEDIERTVIGTTWKGIDSTVEDKKRFRKYVRLIVKELSTGKGAPKYAMNFLLIALVREIESATGKNKVKDETCELVADLISEKLPRSEYGLDVRKQYNRWCNRREEIGTKLHLLFVVEPSLFTADADVLIERIFFDRLSSNRIPLEK